MALQIYNFLGPSSLVSNPIDVDLISYKLEYLVVVLGDF